jgi:hypothetical protein
MHLLLHMKFIHIYWLGRCKEEEEKEEVQVVIYLRQVYCPDLAAKKKKPAAVQSEPPRVGLSKIFRNGVYPVGEEVEYIGE